MKNIFNLLGKFKKSNPSNKPAKVKSALILKHSTYNIVIIALAVAAAIVVNVLATVLSDRLPLQLDLSLEKEMSLSEENIDFVKSVDKDVDVVICASKEGYIGGTLSQVAQSMYQVADSNDTKYYTQAASLLESYEKYNKNIKVTFADPNKSSFAEIQKIADGIELSYGDILVYAKSADGSYRTRAVTYTDIYGLYDASGYAAYGYGGYTINACKIETAVTGAIYAVIGDAVHHVDFVTGHSSIADLSALKKNFELNGFEVNEIKDEIITRLSEDAEIVVVAAPTTDFAEAEIDVLARFLDNSGKRGKSLITVLSCADGDVPNFYSFLNEWGIDCDSDSKLFETDQNNYLTGDPTTMGFTSAQSPYTESVNKTPAMYISGANVPLTAAYSAYGSRTTTPILNSSDTVVAAPLAAPADWTPTAEYKKQSYAGAIATSDIITDEDGNAFASYVVAFSGLEFCSGAWDAYDAVGNTKFTLSVASSVCGKDDSGISFVDKIVTEYVFTQPSAAATNIMRIVFIVLIPLGILAAGIIIWSRRRTR